MSASQLFKLKEEKYGSKQKYDAGGWFAVRESMKMWKIWKYENIVTELMSDDGLLWENIGKYEQYKSIKISMKIWKY